MGGIFARHEIDTSAKKAIVVDFHQSDWLPLLVLPTSRNGEIQGSEQWRLTSSPGRGVKKLSKFAKS
jgi:hypothetical protein